LRPVGIAPALGGVHPRGAPALGGAHPRRAPPPPAGLPDSVALLLLRRELLQRESAQGGSGHVLPHGRRSGVSTCTDQAKYQSHQIRPSEQGIEPIMPGCLLSLGRWIVRRRSRGSGGVVARGGGGGVAEEEEIARGIVFPFLLRWVIAVTPVRGIARQGEGDLKFCPTKKCPRFVLFSCRR
jgi:hypothetical protein